MDQRELNALFDVLLEGYAGKNVVLLIGCDDERGFGVYPQRRPPAAFERLLALHRGRLRFLLRRNVILHMS